MTIDFDIPKGWRFDIYHLQDNTWTASLSRYRYAKKTIVLKGKASTLELAIIDLKKELITRAHEV